MSGRDEIEVEALLTDQYLESLLAARAASTTDAAFGWAEGGLDRGVRLASLRLRRDLPRFHPSFRFEERLALRLAEAAGGLRMAQAAGMEGAAIPVARGAGPGAPLAGLDEAPDNGDLPAALRNARPLLIGGAMASAALSIAGAAWVAWRRSRTGSSPMARAVRAAHAARAGRERAD